VCGRVKGLAVVTGIVVVILLIAMVALSLMSQRKSPPGLLDGRLRPCPQTPNCLCSEYPDSAAHIAPLLFDGNADEAWARARQALLDSGGSIVQEQGDYLAATYTSLVFRFVDDLEMRLDRQAKQIHIRSASRVGHSDLGVNRKRVGRLRELFAKQ